MALGKYTRVDGRRSSSWCSTVTVVVFVALCLVGVWMMTSSSVVPVNNGDEAQETKNEVKEQTDIKEEAAIEIGNSNTRQFEDNPGDLPEDATKGDTNVSSEDNPNSSEKQDEKLEENPVQRSSEDTKTEDKSSEDTTTENEDKKTEDEGSNTENESNTDSAENSKDSDETSTKDSDSNESEKKFESDDNNKPDTDESEKQSDNSDETTDNRIEEKVEENDNKESDENSSEKNDNTKQQSSNEVYPSGAQSELQDESTTETGSWSTQAAESKSEKESQESSKPTGYNWKVCNVSAGPDFIPCLDNWKAIRTLRSTKHYEHRERHCPEEPPTCVVPVPEGYKRSIEWPRSREKIWYHNVPHTKLAEVKGHQNWVKVTGEYLTFPGGGTQFKHGALHYIDFIQETVPDIAWGKRTRVILDVGCGVASFGGFLFERDVLAMSLAPKDEHEAQVQFALERGIPAISAVMGTKRLPFPGKVFDAVHCARCRVPWHIEGGKLLLELNRVLRPGGFFVWSATPIYQKLPEDVEIWNAMKSLTKAICWELVSISKDQVNGVGVAVYRKPSSTTMASLSCFLLFALSLLTLSFVSSSTLPDPEMVVQEVQRSINASRRNLGYLSCGTGNPIDDCWRCHPNWENNRQRLADCAIGFGKDAIGGRNGRIYEVTDSGDDDAVNPKPGTLRYAAIQDEPLWIIFKRDMVITLKQELLVNSFKTIDGRGASVHIAGGGCITIHYVSNVIVHGIHIHDCKPTGNTNIRDSPEHSGFWTQSDGDGVSIFNSKHVWIDHCSLSNCRDGLIDAIHGSTAITISNNYMTHHDKVMLLGHSDSYTQDKDMQVTIAFNHFGEGLVQRMPRCRHGYFHVVNNDYTHWEMYAIGGSANPTINSQGNRFLAPNIRFSKEVTKHEDAPQSEWMSWNWRSEGDMFLNGAYFRQSGAGASSIYARASSLSARPSSLVGSMTITAGALTCRKGNRC